MGLSSVTRGMIAGAAGVAAMTAVEKLEQRVTGRPDSYVPSRTLGHLLKLDQPDADRVGRNHLMHWGTGILLGAVRGIMAERGRRGARGSALHTAVRLATDQTLENASGVGSPPWTWPRHQLAIDVAHKAVYGWVTGWVADRLVPARPGSSSAADVDQAIVVPPTPDDVVLPMVAAPDADESTVGPAGIEPTT